MARKIKQIKLVWKYVGGENQEKKEYSEMRLRDAYNFLFKIAYKKLMEKKGNI